MLSWGLYKKDVTWGKRCCPCKEAPVFWSINWTAALFHLLNTVATLGLWAASDTKDQVYQLTETSAPWTNATGTSNCTTGMPSGATLSFQTSDEWCVSRVTVVTSNLSLWSLVIAFHFLSFVFQGITMMQWNFSFCGTRCIRESYVDEVNDQGTNVLRMIEYSISATLMQIGIALVLGIWQRLVIMGIAFLTVVTMLLGLVAEQLNALSILAEVENKILNINVGTLKQKLIIETTSIKDTFLLLKSPQNRSYLPELRAGTDAIELLGDAAKSKAMTRDLSKTLAWAAHFTGWLSMGGAWAILGRQFYYTIHSSDVKPPEFIYVIVGVIALLYCGFGVIQLVQLCCSGGKSESKQADLNRAVEIAYTVNSLTSKTFLGWIIFANALGGMAQS